MMGGQNDAMDEAGIAPELTERQGTLLKQREPHDGTYDRHDNSADNNQLACGGLCRRCR